MDLLVNIGYGAAVILGLGLLIFIHELGHFLMAKRHGVRVEAFSLGMGPILWKRTWNGTEYRISAVPLGGYVKMAGENIGDPRSGAPDELQSKTAWQRFQIFAAGAVMNLLLAFPLSIIAFLLGRAQAVPVIAIVAAPEGRAGLRAGDAIVEIGGLAVTTHEEYRKEIVRRPRGTKVPVKALRGGETLTFEVEQSGSEAHALMQPMLAAVHEVKSGSAAEKAGFRAGDVIAAMDGERITDHAQIVERIRKSPGREIAFTLRRPGSKGEWTSFEARLTFAAKKINDWPEDFHLMAAQVGEAVANHPADVKLDGKPFLEKGDTITGVEGAPVRSWQDLKDALRGRAGKATKVTRRRNGAEATAEVTPLWGPADEGMVGIRPLYSSTIAVVPETEGSWWYAQGLRSGDVIQGMEVLNKKGELEMMRGEVTVADLRQHRGSHTSFKLVVKRGTEDVTLDVAAKTLEVGDAGSAGLLAAPDGTIILSPQFVRRWALGEAVKAGLWEPIDITLLTLELLKKLVVRDESAKNLAGPVGIVTTSFRQAQAGAGNLLWILALITVNLGVFNVLPIPILDGGHMLLLAIEKVRGAPPSAKFVERFQLTGLVLLLALIVYVTFQDVARLV